MTYEMIMVLLVLAAVLAVLIFTKISADVVLPAGLTLLMVIPHTVNGQWVFGLISPQDALKGFSNPAIATIGVLFVVVTGLKETGGIDWVAGRLLGRPKSLRVGLLRLIAPVSVISAFLNNTPVVAMMIPVLSEWSRRRRFPVSKLMIPLSYAAILGGSCTLIGTSANLVVAGLAKADADIDIGMFDITPIGIVAVLLGGAMLVFLSPLLLPDRTSATSLLSDPKEYSLEMIIPATSALNGKTVEQAGLRRLPGCYLAEITREGENIAPVDPGQMLKANDRLLFVGVVDSIRDLQNMRGLEPATDQIFKLNSPRYRRRLYEAVISTISPVVGQTVRKARFRNRYNAVVIAVARAGKRVTGRIGDIEMRPGDVLLLEADQGFGERFRNSRDFLLVSGLRDSVPRRHNRAPIAAGLLALMVAAATSGIIPMLAAALIAAGGMVVTRCCSLAQARRSIDWSLLIVIGSALGIGEALYQTEAAKTIADAMITVAGQRPWLALAAIYLGTMLATELITHNAAAALMFPFALETANNLEVNFLPFVIALMMAASASFSTPIGYQTNLMVYGPGGYRFADFLRMGLVMNFAMAVIVISLVPLLFPFH